MLEYRTSGKNFNPRRVWNYGESITATAVGTVGKKTGNWSRDAEWRNCARYLWEWRAVGDCERQARRVSADAWRKKRWSSLQRRRLDFNVSVWNDNCMFGFTTELCVPLVTRVALVTTEQRSNCGEHKSVCGLFFSETASVESSRIWMRARDTQQTSKEDF